MDLDFGYNGNVNVDNNNSDNGNGNNGDITNIDTGKIDNDTNGVSVDNIDDIDDSGENGNVNKTKQDDKQDTNDSNVDLAEGSSVEVGDKTYTVDKDGNLIDENGNVFKEAKEVKSWIAEFDKVDDTDEDLISINSIQEAIGIEITDDNDKPIEFENSIEGIKSYVQSVIESAREEHYETAINSLYQKYPIIQDVLNYYIANGNSLHGYGEVRDRSNITINDDNEAQQEAIIRAAWEEQGRKGDINGYINYLKSSGTLLATAREELQGLQEADRNYKEQLAKEAERIEKENIENLQKYWNGVHDIIKARKIAGYEIPENIVVDRNGQKIAVTPEDFFNYLYRVDKDGYSAYMKDLAKETPESRRDDEILRAYLKFVGGNYSNLVNMAINKEKVNILKLKAKERTKNTVRINKPTKNANTGVNIDLGYN